MLSLFTTRENLSKLIAKSGKKPIIVTGILGNERAQDIIPLLSQNAHSLYLVRAQSTKSCSPEALVSLIQNHNHCPNILQSARKPFLERLLSYRRWK